MNLEKLIEWGAIVLVCIMGVRWLAGLFGTGDPVSGLHSNLAPGPAYYQGWPYGTGVVVMAPGIVGPQWPRRWRNR
jgi:hypothetical protein